MRFDQRRVLRVRLDLPPQPTHLVVDAAVPHFRRAPRREFGQLVAREHQARMLEKRTQQPKLRRAQRHRHAVVADDFAPAHVNATAEAAPDISFSAMSERVTQIGALVADDPAVQTFQCMIGAGRTASTLNNCRFFITLKERDRRDAASVVINRLRRKTADIPGITMFFQVQQDLNVGGLTSKTQFQYTLRTADIDELNTWGPRILDRLKQIPALRDVTSDQQATAPALSLEIDRQAASRFGIQTQAINNALYNAYGPRQVAQFSTQVSQYKNHHRGPARVANRSLHPRKTLHPLAAHQRPGPPSPPS